MNNTDQASAGKGVIRPARKTDIDALCLLEDSSFPTDHLSRRQFRYHIKNPKAELLVIASPEDDEPVAYILTLLRSGLSARIYSVSVREDLRGKGLGKRLIEAACRHAQKRGFRDVVLEARVDDPAAIALYERLGFKRVGVLRAYYKDGVDGIKMLKRLDPL